MGTDFSGVARLITPALDELARRRRLRQQPTSASIDVANTPRLSSAGNANADVTSPMQWLPGVVRQGERLYDDSSPDPMNVTRLRRVGAQSNDFPLNRFPAVSDGEIATRLRFVNSSPVMESSSPNSNYGPRLSANGVNAIQSNFPDLPRLGERVATPQNSIQHLKPEWSPDVVLPSNRLAPEYVAASSDAGDDIAVNGSRLSPDVIAGMQSDDPQVRLQSRRKALGPYRDYVEPNLPDAPHVADHHGEKHGLIKNTLHRLEHGGKAALIGIARGGVGGGLAGLGAGIVSPEFADRLEYNTVTKPRL
jgi:hypothetical protein